MTGMFPGSGVPPQDAKNSILDPNTINCDELWYSTSRCQPRFDPAAANAQLAELINTVNAGEVQYDCDKLDQVQLGIKYLVQRGLMKGDLLEGGPRDYIGGLTPPATRLHDFLQIWVTPNVNNEAPVRLNLDGHGLVPVLRNDGLDLKPMDLRGGVPVALVYYGGNWFVPYLVPSQSPEPFKGTVTYWVRTDGSDLTGDGSANSPDKAFRTINFAYNTGITNFNANPDLTLDIRLGIPGIYDYAQFVKFPGTVMLTGDPAGTNFLNYRIQSSVINGGYTCLEVDESSAIVNGVNLLMNAVHPTLGGSVGLLCWRNARCVFMNSGVDNMTGAAGVASAKSYMLAAGYSTISLSSGNIIFDSHGSIIGRGLAASGNGSIQTIGYQTTPVFVTYKDSTFSVAGYAAEVNSNIGVSDAVIGGVILANVTISNTIGPKYNAQVCSFINGGGKSIPGSAAGSVADYGVFHA